MDNTETAETEYVANHTLPPAKQFTFDEVDCRGINEIDVFEPVPEVIDRAASLDIGTKVYIDTDRSRWGHCFVRGPEGWVYSHTFVTEGWLPVRMNKQGLGRSPDYVYGTLREGIEHFVKKWPVQAS